MRNLLDDGLASPNTGSTEEVRQYLDVQHEAQQAMMQVVSDHIGGFSLIAVLLSCLAQRDTCRDGSSALVILR